MKNKYIRKIAISLALVQALSLSGCKSNKTDPVELSSFEKTVLEIVEPEEVIDENNGIFDYRVDLLENEYSDITEDNLRDINSSCNMYNKYGKYIGKIEGYHRVTAIKTNGQYTLIDLDGKYVYVENLSLTIIPNLTRTEYVNTTTDSDKVINDTTIIYDSTGRYIGYKCFNEACHEIASNGEYSLVTFEDGISGFVRSDFLISAVKKVDSYGYIRKGAYLYLDKELTMPVKPIDHDYITYVFLKGNDYAFIGDIDYRENFYVRSEDVELFEDFIRVDGYGYINGDISGYYNKELTDEKATIDSFSVVYVYNINDKWAEIYNYNDEQFYFVDIKSLEFLGDRFIDIDLGSQRMSCYISGRYTERFQTRSGRDISPTHIGAFDIDWMAEEWKFTNYDNCYAHHWIPYNEFGEGIHDLIGDDEQNYGNEAYHQYGSHGCVRVPSSASQYVYDNYEVGDLVLVHK